jgi:betaine lipid synthase
MMAQYIGLDKFKAIYVVDLCHSLCEVAKAKVKAKGWKNVFVVEGDACTFQPKEGKADLVTFSYSLSMIPPFMNAVDNAIDMLAPEGLLGATDFFISSKYDLPMRQMTWARRFFWRSVFDIDSIDLGPERRSYLEHRLERVWEINSQGSIPYVPYFRAPYYVWIGQPHVTGRE